VVALPTGATGQGEAAVRSWWGGDSEGRAVRIVLQVVVPVMALLVGFGTGYLQWGSRSATLAEDLRVARAECEQRVADAERRARAAEDRVQQETRARQMVEDALHRVSPQK
jgi:hypothetical protein